MDNNFECIRCMYTTDKLKNIKYHLNRKIKCDKTNLACMNYTDEEIEEASLIRINKRNNIKCEFCKKTYTNKITLFTHQKNYCKKITKELLDDTIKNNNEDAKDIKNEIDEIDVKYPKDAKDTVINETNIINNNITNNIININLPISFDKEWNIEHIDNYLKTLLLICDNKFTFFLDNVLKNKINLNVVLDKNMSEAYVFTDNEYKNIEKDELLSKSMEKIYNHLIKIKDEFNDTQDNCNDIIKQEVISLNQKYGDYLKNDTIKDYVHEYLSDIYDSNKKEAYELYVEFKNKNMITGF